MNILDSSAWIEFFIGNKNAKIFRAVIENPDQLIVPSITLYEVFKKFLVAWNEEAAMECIALMKTGKVIDMDIELSILAATLSQEHHLAMADSIILATAQTYNATIWTQDINFKNIKRVKYFKKG